MVIPTLFFWLFADTFLVPKLEQLWRDTGLTGSKAQWLIGVSDVFHHNFYFILIGLLGLLFLVEFRWSSWTQYRRAVIAGLVLLFHTAVLVEITAIATTALLAAPIHLKHK
jgi:type II secretory pathway component PulF